MTDMDLGGPRWLTRTTYTIGAVAILASASRQSSGGGGGGGDSMAPKRALPESRFEAPP